MTTPVERLTLRGLRTSDEAVFAQAHAQLQAEGFEFGLMYRPDIPWDIYLRNMSDYAIGRNLPDRFVASTFLLAEVDGVVVGRTSIRHELNDFLVNYGGHVGYAVVPEQRRQGYALEILRQSVGIARAMGIEKVLVTCDDDNIGSIKTIENGGGVLDNVVALPPRNNPRRRYWI